MSQIRATCSGSPVRPIDATREAGGCFFRGSDGAAGGYAERWSTDADSRRLR